MAKFLNQSSRRAATAASSPFGSKMGIFRVQTVPQPSALLDLRFSPHDGHRNICAVVSSTATLALFRLFPDEEEPLRHINTMDIAAMSHGEIQLTPGEEILFTSFGWHPSRVGMMVITTSTGHVYLVQLTTLDGNWELTSEPVITHTLEAWCTVISPLPVTPTRADETQKTEELSFRVYSGGDDSMFRSRTCNWNEGSLAQSLPALESRDHDAGVTAILPLFTQDNHELVVTGSYDEYIRLFLVPPFGRPKNLAEGMLGGGVWRLNLIDLDTTSTQNYTWRARILASCMHAGPRVVELLKSGAGEYLFKVLGRFEEHKSMNYGSDFQPGWENMLSVVSTSFYDKLLCLWEFEIA
ncbi:hypothetical protein CHGG_00445 [Chaetomium globosum CBS 148.51]|uniref:Anaphase-promoting complex subunit 4 WD40 domain-containing protein n=1 Tax=Chaetomium globosum (strain ATCC 6205 / CBS 148.51 / DSM 1962 / NBRC 6347 / NRRL 1970) TaxID=306901 RepID=Q2HH59_CHAGB|nr:uncharacterized protein CHGG_00445 [Chaetomium globosum CBS 148.51]EAQ92210.1 hypothetical protein CHGG_00445 [Chaetomium globosum CBS 148.51]